MLIIVCYGNLNISKSFRINREYHDWVWLKSQPSMVISGWFVAEFIMAHKVRSKWDGFLVASR